MTLTKSDIAEQIWKKTGNTKVQSAEIVDSLLEIIKQTLENGEDILISGLGKFSVKEKNRRRGRNPASGEDLMLDARGRVTFRCSGVLKDKLNTGKRQKTRKRSAK